MVLMDCDQQQGPGAQMESRSPAALRVPLDRSSALTQAYGVFQLKGQGTAGTTGPLHAAFPPHPRRRAGLCMCRLRAGLGGEGRAQGRGLASPSSPGVCWFPPAQRMGVPNPESWWGGLTGPDATLKGTLSRLPSSDRPSWAGNSQEGPLGLPRDLLVSAPRRCGHPASSRTGRWPWHTPRAVSFAGSQALVPRREEGAEQEAATVSGFARWPRFSGSPRICLFWENQLPPRLGTRGAKGGKFFPCSDARWSGMARPRAREQLLWPAEPWLGWLLGIPVRTRHNQARAPLSGEVWSVIYHQRVGRVSFPSGSAGKGWYHSNGRKLLIGVKEENEKAGLKLNTNKTKITASGPITSW